MLLTLDELRYLAEVGPLDGEAARDRVARRRAEMADAAELVAPDLVVGDAFVPVRREAGGRSTLTGLATSRGSARGTARIVRGPSDFERVGAGDVVVIPFSDVGWTPLFARASAVIAEAGGLLSHSSIVAREYGIPCVVSVADACGSIPDGATVTVDGVTGTIVVAAPGAPAAPAVG
jgi:pyruvate,water dikinase